MKRKYNNKFLGVLAWLGNKYDFDPLFLRIAMVVAFFAFPAIGFGMFIAYILADILIVDNSQYDDKE